jgi:hypothetical protein
MVTMYHTSGDAFDVSGSRWNIDSAHLKTMCSVESELHHTVHGHITRSSHGALGICQIKPATAKDMRCSDIITRSGNIDCAARYLSRIREERCWMIPEGTQSQWMCMVGHYHDGLYRRRPFSKAGKRHIGKFVKRWNADWYKRIEEEKKTEGVESEVQG